jgi:hypothetical protein
MKLPQLFEFLVGFFGCGYLCWFFSIKDPKFDFGSAAGITVFVFELLILNFFMFFFAKNTKRFPGFLIHPMPVRDYYNVDSYFFKGLFVFSAVASSALIFIVFYYSIIPGLLWIWSGDQNIIK